MFKRIIVEITSLVTSFFSFSFSDNKKLKNKIKNEKKELKKVDNNIKRNVVELLPFVDVTEDDCILLKNGILDIYQIETKDLNSLSEEDKELHISELSQFFRGYNDDIKLVSMNFPVNTKIQQEHILNKINNTENRVYKKLLNKKLEQLKELERLRTNKEFYFMFFYESEQDKTEKEIYIRRKLNGLIGIEQIDLEKKIKILYKLNNQNSEI